MSQLPATNKLRSFVVRRRDYFVLQSIPNCTYCMTVFVYIYGMYGMYGTVWIQWVEWVFRQSQVSNTDCSQSPASHGGRGVTEWNTETVKHKRLDERFADPPLCPVSDFWVCSQKIVNGPGESTRTESDFFVGLWKRGHSQRKRQRQRQDKDKYSSSGVVLRE